MTHILITNDDGVNAPGLLALAREMGALGEISILAPDRNWSAAGHSKTMHRPMRIREVQLADGTPAYASDGAPSDCVALALLGFIEAQIDLVVSGINPHANIGYDVTYSGTVAAAREAAIAGIPGIAVSLDSRKNTAGPLDYGPAAAEARKLAARLLERGFPPQTAFNVNVPDPEDGRIRGTRTTRQGLRVYRDQLDRRLDPHNEHYYWIGGEAPTGIPKEGTDYGAIKQGYVSITPLKLDLTDYQVLESIRDLDGGG